jgi:serine/threonine protein phosphatase PrpC
MSFDIDVGHASSAGPREHNEDFAAVQRPAPADTTMGWIAALADGVAGGGGGRVAAQTSVMTLVEDYFGAPPTWDTTVVLERLIRAQNAWLADHNRRRAWARDAGTALTTLTALVLRGHSWTLAHVGDSRAWLVRGAECTQLTHDHALPAESMADGVQMGSGTLTRAVGLDDHVQVDFLQGDLQIGDALLLTSDGVHGVLARRDVQQLCTGADSAQAAAEALVARALSAGSRDNATALVLRVRGLDAGRYDDVLRAARARPLPGRLQVGSVLDGYTVTAQVADTGVHRLYQARDNTTRELVAIKLLHESRASDPDERAMLAHEAWLGARLTERLPGRAAAGAEGGGFVRVRDSSAADTFYVVFDWHAGRTLEQRLADGQRFTVAEIVSAAIAVGRALGRLHRAGVAHRDIKPANLHLADDGVWRILDLGVAVSGREPRVQRTLHAGTPSYMNPEQWGDEPAPADAGSDLFALGVTLYRWLTGKLPYGEVEPYQIARYRRDPKPPSRLAPEVPIWLDHVVCKAVAREAAQRFETAEEFVLALERGASRPLNAPPATPLFKRDPAAACKAALIVSLLFNALLVVWLLFLPR